MSAQHRRSSSSSSGRGGFNPAPPQEAQSTDFCNSFWTNANQRPVPGKKDEGDLILGRDGYEALMGRMKTGTRTLEDLRALFKERASTEDEYAKRLGRLSRSNFGVGEIGHMERSCALVKAELDAAAKSHSELSSLLKAQENQVMEFINKREAVRKNPQANIEKLWKTKREQREIVLKAKAKYETDAIAITGMHAQAALSQGRDLDKVQMKMDKAMQTVQINERDYRNYVNVLKDTTLTWNLQWRAYLDLCQDQEEERIDFQKSRMWDWANALSTVAVAEDESAERSRTSLEQVLPAQDLAIFVSTAGSGRDIPDPLEFVDHSRKEAPPRQTYQPARFPRSSTLGRGVTHSPSAVEDIGRQFTRTPPPSALPQQRPPPAQVVPPQQQQQQQPSPRGAPAPINLAAAVAANSMQAASGRPVFAPSPPSPDKYSHGIETAMSRSSLADTGPPPQRPTFETSTSSSRFNLSPAANPSARGASGSPAGTKPGHVSAAAFQRRAPSNANANMLEDEEVASAPARYEPETLRHPPTEEVVAPAAMDDDGDDPILRALEQLQSTPSTQPTRRGPPAGAIALPGMADTSRRDAPGGDNNRSQHRLSQQNLNNHQNGFGARPSSRPSSPAAQMMQAPHQPPSQVPGVVGQYGQAFPGERSNSRPSSRPGSVVSVNSNSSNNLQQRMSNAQRDGSAATLQHPLNGQQQQQGRTSSPGPAAFAGIGARGRSPSPQPDNRRAGSQNADYQRQASQHQPSHSQQYGLGPIRTVSPLGFPSSQPPPPSAPQPPAGYQANSYGVPQSGYGAAPSGQQGYSQAYSQQQPSQQPPPPQQPQQPNYGYQSQAPPAQAPAPERSYTPQHQFQQRSHTPVQQTQYNGAPVGYPSSPAHGGAPVGIQGSQAGPAGYASSPVGASVPTPPPQPASHPTGQYTEDGKPILFYVNAIYDYQASGPDEFSFSVNDVISVTATDPDGWWQGCPVGVGSGGTFPSNFTELLQ